MFEYLKFDSNPQFDVLAKAKEYVRAQGSTDMEEWYADDYVLRLRGPVIGRRQMFRTEQFYYGIRKMRLEKLFYIRYKAH